MIQSGHPGCRLWQGWLAGWGCPISLAGRYGDTEQTRRGSPRARRGPARALSGENEASRVAVYGAVHICSTNMYSVRGILRNPGLIPSAVFLFPCPRNLAPGSRNWLLLSIRPPSPSPELFSRTGQFHEPGLTTSTTSPQRLKMDSGHTSFSSGGSPSCTRDASVHTILYGVPTLY